MESEIIREKLHQFIDTTDDSKVEAIYTLLLDDIESGALRRNLVLEERQKYLLGVGKSFSREEVKEMALSKEKRDGLLN